MGGERKGQNVKTSVCLYIKNCVFVRGEATGVTFSGQNGEKKNKKQNWNQYSNHVTAVWPGVSTCYMQYHYGK